MPNDYFKRTENNRYYRPPGGAVADVPSGCWYGILLPPLKTRRGWIGRGVHYNRKCASKQRTVMDSYSFEPKGFCDWDAESRKRTPLGVLLGTVEEKDFQYTRHDFEGSLPLHQYLEVVYAVALRDAGKMNSVGVTLSLKCTG